MCLISSKRTERRSMVLTSSEVVYRRNPSGSWYQYRYGLEGF
jgi:hypothetical protein